MKKVYLFLLTCLFLASCDNFDDMNVNPNLPSQASNAQLIANATLYLPGLSSAPQGEFYAQYLAETQYVNASLYTDVNFNFYNLYTGPLMNLEAVLKNQQNNENGGTVAVNQVAVAKILKAYFFWHMTDRWGDVPYSDAFQGLNNFTPAYDTQESIYNNLFQLLDEANATIVPGTNIPDDVVYNGDMTKWKKLANTIHLLMALRLSEVDATKGAAEFNKALTNGIMASNSDNLTFQHLATEANQNFWYDQIANQGRFWWALSKTLVNELKPVNDPRLPVFGNVNGAGEYVGLELGLTEGLDQQDPSLLGDAIWKQDAPVYLVTYAEALFAKAEAAKRGWIGGGDAEAAANYALAVEQSIVQWTGTNTGAAELLAQPQVAYDPAKAIEQIAEQRWVHLFMHGYEAWAEWRRTGYPNNLTAPGGKQVPTRQGYPIQEQFNNTASYQQATQRQFGGQDDLYGHVWWDVN
ncbi:SusD/RagB family nutrient-binding outer membrane lipoprotein [Pontibacter liquoris]|uniref:SusD/RagB family nutrient-binding outer membrane lipoprotein n=1 Tax=Pontibacter liquoris TaxID=2905677 RepID=UPI001FA785BB|nr:SusD/RagB family nutrient-binding outer membrane lipoprotein [Pontibacter liquoris]